MKRVLISQRVDVIESYRERRDALDQRWAELLWEAGCIGLPVPNHSPTLKALLKLFPVDGILLTGGNTHVKYGGAAPERDEVEELLISYSIRSNTPLLGVCRGMQSVVLYFGGTLHKVEGHVAVRHDLSTGRSVNSYHEYTPNILPDELTALAQTEDKKIEYIVHKKLPIAGIMWHPEREPSFVPADIELIQNLFAGRNK